VVSLFGWAKDAQREYASVLADLIGIADGTATRWVALASRDRSVYIAQR
jgi:hypothetical protein